MTAVRAPAEPGSITLHGGDARIEVVPAEGGRVRSLQLAGREWLVQAVRSSAPPSSGGVLAGAGWAECAPTADTHLPTPGVDLRTSAEGHQLTCVWQGDALPWTLTRTLLVRLDGSVEAAYDARTTGRDRLPFLWGACLLMPLDQQTRLRLPAATRFHVQAVTGAERDARANAAQPWPRLTLAGRVRDLSEPWQLPRSSMVTTWLDVAGSLALRVTQGERQLSVTVDGEGTPHCGLVLDRAGVRAGARVGAFSRGLGPAFALMPALGGPDLSVESNGGAKTAAWLTPGKPRQWRMILRAGKPS
jgi:hypothetical protein